MLSSSLFAGLHDQRATHVQESLFEAPRLDVVPYLLGLASSLIFGVHSVHSALPMACSMLILVEFLFTVPRSPVRMCCSASALPASLRHTGL